MFIAYFLITVLNQCVGLFPGLLLVAITTALKSMTKHQEEGYQAMVAFLTAARLFPG
jgi:hypothetical protein